MVDARSNYWRPNGGRNASWPESDPATADLGRLTLRRQVGNECLHGAGARPEADLLAFWRWSVSDLVSNLTRGRFAEFIVAQAVGISTDGVREEWDAFDLLTSDGVRIQVKSSAYIQSWAQRELSSISFVVKARRGWDADSNRQDPLCGRHAEVYVFALLAHRHKPTVDPLNLDQWEFYVLPCNALNDRKRSQHSIMLKALRELSGGPVAFLQLKTAVEAAAKANQAALRPK